MYIGYGYSNKSEKEAFKKAVKFVRGHVIPFNKVRLDKYYSNEKDIQERGEGVEACVCFQRKTFPILVTSGMRF